VAHFDIQIWPTLCVLIVPSSQCSKVIPFL
jgi:hypothetical protein